MKKGPIPRDRGYSKIGKDNYGSSCEFLVDGRKCDWEEATCDVHHINYQEHNRLEEELQQQLPKSEDPEDLCVLCPNHHRYVHNIDMGPLLLDFLPPRKDS